MLESRDFSFFFCLLLQISKVIHPLETVIFFQQSLQKEPWCVD